jgi:hypothetical protein
MNAAKQTGEYPSHPFYKPRKGRSSQIYAAGCVDLKIILIKIKVHPKCTYRLIFYQTNKMNVLLYPDVHTGVIFKFWETFASKYHKTANTLVMFKDTLNEDILSDGWFLLASFFLWQ